MANETPTDPAEAFREWVTQWERGFDSFANQVMGTEGFSQVMNEAQKAQLSMQRAFNRLSTQQLENLNMPTRDDVLRLAEAIQDIGRRLERIEDKLELGPASTQTARKPKRTRQPAAKAKAGAGAAAAKPAAGKPASSKPSKKKDKSDE